MAFSHHHHQSHPHSVGIYVALSILINVHNYKWERRAASCNVRAYVCTCITAHDLISEIKLGVNRQDQTVTNLTGSFITQWHVPSPSAAASQPVLQSCTDRNTKVLFKAGVESGEKKPHIYPDRDIIIFYYSINQGQYIYSSPWATSNFMLGKSAVIQNGINTADYVQP